MEEERTLFVACRWLPPVGISLERRAKEAIEAMQGLRLGEVIGSDWFELGWSKKQALAKRVHVNEITGVKKPWERTSLAPNEAYYSLNLWNGRDNSDSIGIAVTLFDPPVDATKPLISGLDSDRFVISGLNEIGLRSIGIQWAEVLNLGRHLANTLGGQSSVASHDLPKKAKAMGIEDASFASAAAFWGVDRSGNSPFHRKLDGVNAKPPFEMAVCESWDQLDAPDPERLRALTKLIAP